MELQLKLSLEKKIKVVSVTILTFISLCANAEFRFKIKKGKINKSTLNLELAESEEEHMQGLMFRKSIKDNEGMLLWSGTRTGNGTVTAVLFEDASTKFTESYEDATHVARSYNWT